MNAEHIEFLVEEPSAEAFLKGLLARLPLRVTYQIHAFQDKHTMLREPPKRLRGYASWIPETYRIVILVDRDDDDCLALKATLERIAREMGLPTHSHRNQGRYTVVNRIVVEELEAWYFGDWEAVCAAYPRVRASVPRKARYRDPDAIQGGTWETFERILQKAGYFWTGLRKREAAQMIVAYMDVGRNRSRSFQVLVAAVAEIDSDP
jgi:hypothetical protein